MPINILMPALSPTMEKGNLAKWLVKEGDSVSAGEVIAEIETDKATMEVEAVDEGKIGRIVVAEGSEDVPVNEVIAVLLEEGEDASAIGDAPKQAKAEAPKEAPKEEPRAAPKSEPAPASASGAPAPAKSPEPAKAPAGPVPEADGRKLFSSPLARRLAKEAGIDIAAVEGSGPHGRIVRRDVEAAIKGGAPKKAAEPARAAASPMPAAAAPAPAAGPSDEAIRKLFEEGSYEIVPHDGMRKTIARRLVEAKQTIPHFYLTRDVTIDALLKLRGELNAASPERDGKPAYKLSVNDMVIKALALALKAVPDANVSWTESGMLKHRHADVGVAVSIPGGLITPIVRRADEKTLSTISNEMKDMARRARERKLQPQEYQGGTSAVSNLGMFGIKDFAAVINPPHATILAVGAGEQRAVVRDGAVAIATQMSVTLSTDHRAVDGALGAQLLDAFVGYVEKPMGMLV
ncbi:MAG: pyruvate dehydrogenase complex dihydrolipoamide acetyltransferase [Flavobacteriaceae bacterium]